MNPALQQVAVPILRQATFADAASVAKKGSASRRCFHEPVWHRAARSRSGFAQDELPLMASPPYLAFEWDRLTMCDSTAAWFASARLAELRGCF